jgi:hypothetical protein
MSDQMDLRELVRMIGYEAERQQNGMTRAEYGATIALLAMRAQSHAVNQLALAVHQMSNELRAMRAVVTAAPQTAPPLSSVKLSRKKKRGRGR